MKLLLEGSLSEALMLKDLLAGILQAEAPGLTMLKLCIANTEPYGDLYFLGGKFVVGARLTEKEIAADEALKHLLQLKEANFYYYACDSLEECPDSKSLKIDLKELIESGKNVLPIPANELLDKIFNKISNPEQTGITSVFAEPTKTEEANEEKSSQPVNPSADKTSLGFTGAQSDVEWTLVNSLLVSGAPGDNSMSLISGPWAKTASSTYQGLRSLSTGQERRHKLRDLILILSVFSIVLIVILCVGWLVMNSPSSEVKPRRFSLHQPAKRHTIRENPR